METGQTEVMQYYFIKEGIEAAYNRTDEKTIIELCKKIGLIYIRTFYNKYTYVEFICKKHKYKGIQKINREALVRWAKSGECKCSYVNRDTEDLKRDPRLDKNIEIIGEYIKTNIKIKCLCKYCGHIFYMTPNKLMSGRCCPKCSANKTRIKLRMSRDTFCKKLRDVNPALEVVGEYAGMNASIMFRCKKCETIQETSMAYHLISGDRGCSKCRGTKGERAIADFLDKKSITYETQKSFINCRSLRSLRFDFYLPGYNVCIEYQGEQHYFPVDFSGRHEEKAIENFLALQERDKIKKEFCSENQIGLLEIPYWEQKNIDEILQNFLNNIADRRDCNGGYSNIVA